MDEVTVTPPPQSPVSFPTSAIVLIVIVGYLLLIIIALLIRRILLSNDICGPCNLCAKDEEGASMCDCCRLMAENCNCKLPRIDGCLDSICPSTKNPNCMHLLMCGCFASENSSGCCDQTPIFDCGVCDCSCACQLPSCNVINCLCFEISIKAVQ